MKSGKGQDSWAAAMRFMRSSGAGKVVGDPGGPYGSARYTAPSESPETFDGKGLVDVETPSGSPVRFKFYDEDGSEYVIAENGQSRRICPGTGDEDPGLREWTDMTVFAKGGDLAELEQVFRMAAWGQDVFKPKKAVGLRCSVQGGRLYVWRWSYADRKWHCVQDVDQMVSITDAEKKKLASGVGGVPRSAMIPFAEAASKDPKPGYSVVEMKLERSVMSDYRIGSAVSEVEPRKQPVGLAGFTVGQVMRKCEDEIERSGRDLDGTNFQYRVDGGKYRNFAKSGIVTAGQFFDCLVKRYGADARFLDCFKTKYSGARMPSYGNGFITIEFET